MPDLSTLLFLSFPDHLRFVPVAVLGLLGLAAIYDAFTGRVPNLLVLSALAVVLFLSAHHEGWPMAGLRTLTALAAFWVLKSVNAFYFIVFRRDAIGMGDAKWTAAAAACFGLAPVFWAWVFGAWLGAIWLGVKLIVGFLCPHAKPRGYVHFAPFLMAGLVLKLYAGSFLKIISG